MAVIIILASLFIVALAAILITELFPEKTKSDTDLMLKAEKREDYMLADYYRQKVQDTNQEETE